MKKVVEDRDIGTDKLEKHQDKAKKLKSKVDFTS